MDNNSPLDALKRQWNKDPMLTLVVGSMVATAASKIINALSAAQGRRAYAKQVNASVKRKKNKR